MRTDAIRPGDVIADKYRVRAILSRSRGFLVEAFHTEFDQRVAVRVLSPAMCDEKEVERFRRESRILAKLESEHVARIVDVGTLPDGSFYYARQYLEGIDLASHIKKRGPLPLAEAVNLILQAAEPVAETHVHNIILRELQPSHLFLTQRLGGAPLLKIIDFGTAKLMRDAVAPTAGDEMTATTMFGLSCYSSPELVRKAKHVDARTDIWSLGAIFYQLLTGRPPFEGEMAMLMLQITKENPVPPSQRRRDLPREIDQIIGWSMAKDVDGRFANIHAFAHALTPYASAEGKVIIQRIGEITRAAKQQKRNAAAVDPDHPETMDGNDLLEDEDTGEATRVQSSSYLAPQAIQQAAAAAGSDEAPLDRTMFIGPGFVPQSPIAQQTAPPAGRPPMASSPGGPVFAGAAAGMQHAPSHPSQPPLLGPSLELEHRASYPGHGRPPMTSDAGAAMSAASFAPGGHPTMAEIKPKAQNQKVALFAIGGAVLLLGIIGGVVAFSGGSDDQQATNETTSASATASAAAAPPPTNEPVATAPPPTNEPVATAPAETETAAASAAPPPASTPVKVAGGSSPAPTHTTTSAPKPTATTKPTATSAPPSTDSGGMGTLVAVAIGGTCAFSVNGASKGTTSSLRVQVKAGTYSVTCRPATGATKSKSVRVPSGGSAMAMFKLQ